MASLGLKTVRDPYTDEELIAIPRLRPDWAVLHVPEADADGNARIYGSPFWDRLMSRAARRVIVTAETIVPSAELARQPELTAIPGLFVSAVVEAPGGAWPGSCFPRYQVDYPAVTAYQEGVRVADALAGHLAAAAARDRGAGGPEQGAGGPEHGAGGRTGGDLPRPEPASR